MTRFSQTTILVSLNLRCYSARKEDKKISAEVATSHNTTTDVGKYNKQLVAKRFLDPITKLDTEIRALHYRFTLPWLNDGIDILPSAMLAEYKAEMREKEDRRDTLVREFCDKWQSEIIPDARQRLNGMFSERDYPVDVRGRFGFGLRYMPVPDAADFRADIGDLERETMRQEIEASLGEAQQAAMRDLWQRVLEPVQAMATRLAAYKTVIVDGKAKTENPFRDSLVQNLRDICDLIPKLNFAGDARLESLRQKIEKELLAESPVTLRESDSTRANVATKAAEICDAIAEFMV